MRETTDPFVKPEDVPWEEIPLSIKRKVFSMDSLMFVLYQLPAGLVTDSDHSHPQEQAAYVVSGEIIIHIGDEQERLTGGACYFVQPDTFHHLEVLEDAVILDCFSPLRTDLLQ
ncbi:MAG: cupin domain-containing protein [Spirochaetia bacterium]|nr:cupin domain-containing protein [Spirochaetia bacterium]MCF7940845.1 cupin domain-containing protein [Spirochaetia bacterium]